MKIKNGTIFAIPLLYDLGWVFAKHLNTDEINPSKNGKKNNISSLLRVYNYFTNDKPVSIPELSSMDMLLDAMPVTGINNRSYKYMKWDILGCYPIIPDDYLFPNVKSYWPPILDNSEEFMVYENIFKSPGGTGSKCKITTKDKVDHLDFTLVRSMELTMFRITLEFLKIKGRDIKKEFGFNYVLEELEYERFIDSPIYSQLSIDVKGKYLYWD